jgi:hypothetical protein
MLFLGLVLNWRYAPARERLLQLNSSEYEPASAD